jgi:hypothetical protein
MRGRITRIIVVTCMVLVVVAWWAVPAIAGCFAEPATCTPANRDHGNSGEHAPDPTIKSHPNANGGAVDNSPSLIYSGGQKGDYCQNAVDSVG